MAANKKLSALPVTTTPALTDRVALLTDPSGSPDDQTCALSDVFPRAAGTLLAVVAYNPGALTTVNTVSTTGEDVDAVNLFITFTVPPSGNVLVRLGAGAYVTNAGETYWWVLRTTVGANVSGTRVHAASDVASLQHHVETTVYITGLTPGASQTYRWGHGTDVGTGHIRYGDNGSATPWGPAVMEVWSAP